MPFHYRWLLLFSCFLALGGCAQSFVLQTNVDVPAPLMQPLPINVAVYYPSDTREHTYTENSSDRPNWAITTGPSQVHLFNQILSSMFASVDLVETKSEANESFDILIVPRVKDIQFALPRETGLGVYEVWIDYELAIKQPMGKDITTLTFTGYGASSISMLQRDSEGLLTAANKAFRELGAQAIVNFTQNQTIQTWLSSNTKESQGG